MKTILIPTDFSKNARNAAFYALSMFDPNDNTFILLNTYIMPTSYSSIMIDLDDWLRVDSLSSMKKEKKELLALIKGNNVSLSTYSEMGRLADVVREMVKSHNIDYIIMGTKGATGLREVFMGSNTFDVIKEVACPVIAVPEHAIYNRLKKIVFAADYQKINRKKVLFPIVELTRKENAELHVLNVTSKDNEETMNKALERIQLENYFEPVEPTYHIQFNESVDEEIENFAKKRGCDMIVMLSREQGVFDIVFQKSITRSITLHSKVPVLVLHDE